MNTVRVFFLVYACCMNVAWAFLLPNSLPTSSINQRSSSSAGTDQAGEPLLLTPLIDAGKLDEARNQSRVSPLLKDVESYAGFLTVNETAKSHLYFWFFPKTTTTDNTSSPVILWLQGGPGCSSLYGLFAENGPFEVTKKGLKGRTHAWTNNYHMLYIDQPVGTGFSFSEEEQYVTTEEDVAEHLYVALVQFFTLFSEFKEHDFYVAGESYGGKYVPAIGRKIHAVAQQPDAYHIPLKGMMIGNGYSDPENMLDYATFLHGAGIIDGNERQYLEELENEARYVIRSGNYSEAYLYSTMLLNFVWDLSGLVNIYDYRSDVAPDFNPSYSKFLNHDRVRQSIHAGNVIYEMCSPPVYHHMESDFAQTARPTIEELLEHYPILFYNGQFDVICAHSLTENFLDKLHWSGASNYASAGKRIWRVGNKVAGYYKTADNLVYTMVRNAGHMVPADQPENALNLINMFIEKKLFDNSTWSEK